eukprot:comp11468_c0_seq1/m.5909 comp11468_c0_seq1/g.5909  ORF comp11468_c0_seq1/g.5909 comp11468_c0_seq1/m.5909 type:complete len:374 (-) comp11468_c0_seq1:967-2088(-)
MSSAVSPQTVRRLHTLQSASADQLHHIVASPPTSPKLSPRSPKPHRSPDGLFSKTQNLRMSLKHRPSGGLKSKHSDNTVHSSYTSSCPGSPILSTRKISNTHMESIDLDDQDPAQTPKIRRFDEDEQDNYSETSEDQQSVVSLSFSFSQLDEYFNLRRVNSTPLLPSKNGDEDSRTSITSTRSRPGSPLDGCREVELVKDQADSFGFAISDYDGRIYVTCCAKNSPASRAKLRIGDEVVLVNGQEMLGHTAIEAQEIIREFVRATLLLRPCQHFKRYALEVPANGQRKLGMFIKGGVIMKVSTGSLAAENGVPENHCLISINGQNCVGVADDAIRDMFRDAGDIVKLVVLDYVVFVTMMRNTHVGDIAKSNYY